MNRLRRFWRAWKKPGPPVLHFPPMLSDDDVLAVAMRRLDGERMGRAFGEAARKRNAEGGCDLGFDFLQHPPKEGDQQDGR